MKKIWMFIMVLALAVATQNVLAVSDEDFAEQSDYYKSLCKNSYKDNKDVCEQYKTWLYNQNQNSLNEMKELKNKHTVTLKNRRWICAGQKEKLQKILLKRTRSEEERKHDKVYFRYRRRGFRFGKRYNSSVAWTSS